MHICGPVAEGSWWLTRPRQQARLFLMLELVDELSLSCLSGDTAPCWVGLQVPHSFLVGMWCTGVASGVGMSVGRR